MKKYMVIMLMAVLTLGCQETQSASTVKAPEATQNPRLGGITGCFRSSRLRFCEIGG
ncbi:MAG: hypothetical protein Q7O66_17730 [Dehalococcoidia bacterium]|nr:hypothetical protein [Dehalococcoidia bacterium]